MSVRSSMSELITALRLAIGDPTPGASQVFSDAELQTFLDARRVFAFDWELRGEYQRVGSLIEYNDFFSVYDTWESDAVLQKPDGTVVTPTTSEWLTGHWYFETAILPPLYIRGKVYDLNAAAANALDAWAAKVALDFDFTVNGESFNRSQKQKALKELAQIYRAKQWANVVEQRRMDLEVDDVD